MSHPLNIDVGHAVLAGDLTLPDDRLGLVVFAHGSGSSRHSTRNRHVAAVLARHGFATLLMDLLTEREEVIDRDTAEYRFDIGLLARRLEGATRWVARQPETTGNPIGYFGASTGAAAAIVAASKLPDAVRAIVSRGGRPDLAGETALGEIRAPTLLIVGSRDTEVLELNRQAASFMTAPHELSLVEGATHLFPEPGTLDEVAELAARWFRDYLGAPRSSSGSGRRERMRP